MNFKYLTDMVQVYFKYVKNSEIECDSESTHNKRFRNLEANFRTN